jgi:hypothetical protein
MRRTFRDLARNADIEATVRQKICGHVTQEMSELDSTVPQREIQVAVGAVISLAKSCELMRDNAPWWEGEKAKRPPGKPSQVAVFLWALKGLNLRLPPCEHENNALLRVTAE